MPQIARLEFQRLPLRVDDFLVDVPLHEVWAVDLSRTPSGITLQSFFEWQALISASCHRAPVRS